MKNPFNTDNNKGNPNSNTPQDKPKATSPFNTDKENGFDFFNINVDKANKSTKSIFDYAGQQLSNFTKDNLNSQKVVSDNAIKSYKSLYNTLSNEHKTYLNQLIAREKDAAKQINNIRNNIKDNSKPYQQTQNQSNTNTPTNTKAVNASQTINDNLKESTTQMKSSTKAMQDIGGAVAKGLDAIANIWVQRFTQGVDNIFNAYESSYHSVSILMNQNQKQYQAWQTSAMSQINAQGMQGSIAISTIMKNLDATTKAGLSGQNAQNKAISDSITQAIAPYIDTTTNAYTDLQQKLGDSFTQSISGMSENIRQNVGESRLFGKTINSVLDKLDPIVLNAKADYADKHLGSAMSAAETEVAQGKMTEQQAENMVYDSSMASSDSYGAITGKYGIAYQAGVAGSEMQGQGTNNIDANQSNMMNFISSASGGANKGYQQGAITNALGISDVIGETTDIKGANSVYQDALKNYNATGNVDASKQLKQNLADNQYNTTNQTRNNLVENASLGVAQFRESNPDTYKAIAATASATTGLLAGFISTGFGRFTGGGGGGGFSGIKNLFSKFGKGGAQAAEGDVEGAVAGGAEDVVGGVGSSAAGDVAGVAGVAGAGEAVSGATGIGSGLMGSLGGMAVAAAPLAVAGGAAVGGGLAIKSGVNDISQGNQANSMNSEKAVGDTAGGLKIAGGAGMVAGGIAIAALGLSNPIGWAALATAGVVVAGGILVKELNKQSASTEALNASYEKQKTSMDNMYDGQQKVIASLQDQVKAATTLEQKKAILTSNGYSKEQVANMSNADINTALQNTSTSNSNQKTDSEGILAQYSKSDKSLLDDTSKKNSSAIYNDIKNKINSGDFDTAKNELAGIGHTDLPTEGDITQYTKDHPRVTEAQARTILYQKALDGGKDDSASLGYAQEQQDVIGKYGITGGQDYTQAQLDAVTSKNQDLEKKYSSAMSELLNDKSAHDSKTLSAQQEKIYASNKSIMMSADKKYWIDKDGKAVDVSSYRKGTPFIRNDGEVAQLHLGEAVLTKEQNKQYTAVANSIPSIAQGLNTAKTMQAMQSTQPPQTNDDIIAAINNMSGQLAQLMQAMIQTTAQGNKPTVGQLVNKDKISANLISLTPSVAQNR